MRPSRDIKPISYVKANSVQVLEKVTTSGPMSSNAAVPQEHPVPNLITCLSNWIRSCFWSAKRKKFIAQCLQDFRSGNRAVLPVLYACVAEPDKILVSEAAHEIAKMLELLTTRRQLLTLRDSFAQSTSMEWYLDWKTVKLKPLEEKITSLDGLFAVIALGTFHPNGYYRYECLINLERFGSRSLPFTLLLMNNWVASIREKAFEISQRLLQAASGLEILSSLSFLDSVKNGQRRAETWWEELYSVARSRLREEASLLTPPTLLGLEPQARRLAYRIALESSFLNNNDELILLQQETDSFNKQIIAECLLKREHEYPDIVALLLKNKMPSLRLLALRHRYEREGLWDGVDQFLFDRNQPVREFACFILYSHGVKNFSEIYREQVRAHPSLGAILGLGEKGESSDAPLVRTFLSSDSPSMVKAALIALAKLKDKDCAETLYAFLLDTRTSRIAYTLARRLNLRYPCAKLYEDFQESSSPVIQHRLVRLIFRGGNWDKLPYLVKLYQNGIDTLHSIVASQLMEWQIGYTKPTLTQITSIHEALLTVDLPEKIRRRIDLSLSGGGYSPLPPS